MTLAEALEQIRQFLYVAQPHQLITANPLMLLAAGKDPDLAQVLEKADLVVPEASGIFWAGEQLGMPFKERVPGIDLLHACCKLASETQKSVYLLGALPGVAEQAANTLCALYPGLRIAGVRHGYFQGSEETAVMAQVHEAAPDFLFVGMSVPRQEKWIAQHLVALGATIVMGVGGSLDVLSGNLKRAPQWMRDLSLEWLYRTLQEPWRLKRIMHLPVFVWKVLTS